MNDTKSDAISADEVAALAAQLRTVLDMTPEHASYLRPITRRTAVRLYRCLCAFSALLMSAEEE